MKKKYLRIAIIVAIVVVIAAVAVMRIDIKPAQKNTPAQSLDTPEIKEDTANTPQPEKTPETPAPPVSDTADDETSEPSIDQGAEPVVDPEPTPEVSDEPAADDPVMDEPVMDEPEPQVSAEPTPSLEPEPPQPARHVCTIEIRCDTVTDTSVLENQAVAPYVPADGVILAVYEVEYTPGESVFDILLRATMEQNIHMEFRDDNLYSGKYIEGINYLYEMDGGPLSGWMYKVNGKFPNYGCAAYEVSDGDAIVWMYTCDLGLDVGDNSSW